MVSIGVASFSVNRNIASPNTILLKTKRDYSFQPSSLVKICTSAHLQQRRSMHTRSLMQLSNVENTSIALPTGIQQKGGTRLSKSLDIDFNVRDYELDQYGVVNNAIYSHYVQQANHEYLSMLGFSVNEVALRGGALAVRELSFKFIAPLRSGDRFVVKVRMHTFSMARLHFDQLIFKMPNMERIVEASGSLVWLDMNYRPVRVPPELISKIIL